MIAWKIELTTSAESLGDVHSQRRVLQGDSLSPLRFALCMITLSLILRKRTASYEEGTKNSELIIYYSWIVSNYSPGVRTNKIH